MRYVIAVAVMFAIAGCGGATLVFLLVVRRPWLSARGGMPKH
jgi:hypothetical protein